MNNPTVTIAVPVYNVEKYVDRCVRSLVEQTYRNLEIILVDDCSPDNSPQICDDWAARDSRIKVIHKGVNEGQGIARNDALYAASGEYICFIDSDDYLEHNAIESLIEAARREAAEVVVFGMKNVTHSGEEVSRIIPKVGEKTYRGRAVLSDFLPDFLGPDPNGNGEIVFYLSSCVLMYTVNKLRSAGWKYVSERKIISEDVYSILDLFSEISSVTVVPQPFYCYCINEASFSRRYTADRYAKVKHFYVETVKLCKEKNYSEDILLRVCSPYIAYTLATLKQEARSPFSLKKRWQIVTDILEDKVLQDVLHRTRNNHERLKRRIIFFLIRKKCHLLSFLLFWIKK